jgi:glycosyltransferase involved in cell wall biosynthesis
MATADIFILPSYREGFGSVIIEAAACGIPTIAYKIDGVIDAVVEGRTGRFVEKGDIDGLAYTIKELGQAQDIHKDLGRAAHDRAVKGFSSTNVSREWQVFYDSLFKRAL